MSADTGELWDAIHRFEQRIAELEQGAAYKTPDRLRSDRLRLEYIARNWQTQLFGETMDGVERCDFIRELDILMVQWPEIP